MTQQDYKREDIKEAIHEAIDEYMTTKNTNGNTPIEQEIMGIMNKAIATMTLRFGIAIIAMAIAGGGMWYTLSDDVSRNTQANELGARYTVDDHNTFAKTINDQMDDIRRDHDSDVGNVREDISDMKADVKFIREKLGG